nr:MAG TPA: hypothetical protein [Caudoviricetes sp.]
MQYLLFVESNLIHCHQRLKVYDSTQQVVFLLFLYF